MSPWPRWFVDIFSFFLYKNSRRKVSLLCPFCRWVTKAKRSSLAITLLSSYHQIGATYKRSLRQSSGSPISFCDWLNSSDALDCVDEQWWGQCTYCGLNIISGSHSVLGQAVSICLHGPQSWVKGQGRFKREMIKLGQE